MNESPEPAEISAATPPTDDFEPGSVPARGGALILDVILVSLVAGFFLTQYFWPQQFPGALDEMVVYFKQIGTQGPDSPEAGAISETLEKAFRFSTLFSYFSFTAYFVILPLATRAGTLGMRVFNLRIQERDAAKLPGLRALLVRSVLKTCCLQFFFPILAFLFLLALGNPRRLAVHDKIAGTCIVRGPAFPKT